MKKATPKPGIHHPQASSDGSKPPFLRNTHFAAYGFSPGVSQVVGVLVHDSTGKRFAGGTIEPPTKDNGFFWIIHFKRRDIAPNDDKDTFTLEVYDADAIESGKPMPNPIDTVEGVIFTTKWDQVVVTYPQNDDPVGTAFSAYGTSPGGGAVTWTFSSGCNGTATQVSPGPDWVLRCYESGTEGQDYTLTVSQGTAQSGQGSFKVETG